MKFFFYIILFLITIIKNKKQDKYKIGRDNDKIKKKQLEIKEKGEYTIKGKYKQLNIKVNSSDIILNFKNGEYNTTKSPLILIGKNFNNIKINFYNSYISSKKGLIVKINEYSNVKVNIISSKFKTSRIFDLKNDYKIKIKNKEKKYENDILISNGVTYDCDENKTIEIENINVDFISINQNSKIEFLEIIEKMKKEKSSLIKNPFCEIKQKERIIVTMTSWKKRIGIVHESLLSLINNYPKPDKVVLNLAIEEFPNKNEDLPDSLLSLLQYENFEIFWVEKNTNVFKKLIPTLYRYKDDLIVTTDDDIIYPHNLIEKIFNEYRERNTNNPMSFGLKIGWKNKKSRKRKKKKISSHFGACSIVKYKHFNERIMELYNKTTKKRLKKGIKCFDDILYTYAALLNGVYYDKSYNFILDDYVNLKNDTEEGFSSGKQSKKLFTAYHEVIRKYIKKTYGVSFPDLMNRRKTELYLGIYK